MNYRILLFFLVTFFDISFSQTNIGTDFWLAFPKIPWDREEGVFIYICSEYPAKGKITSDSIGFEKRFAARPNELVRIEIPRRILLPENEIISNKSIHIESDKPISVYGLNYQKYGSDGFLSFPTNSLGRKYYTISYAGQLSSFFYVIATENNTFIKSIPGSLVDQNISLPKLLKLNKGQVLFIKSEPGFDLTGSFIESNNPIAVFSGNLACFIPDSSYCCANQILEQIPPIKAWGKTFYTAPFAQKKKGDVFRILAAKDETEVLIENNLVATLDRGKFFETILPSDRSIEISANFPILVSQYSTSYQYDTSYHTDPFMALVQPKEQYLSKYQVAIPIDFFDTSNFINVLHNPLEVPNIKFDNLSLYPNQDSLSGLPLNTIKINSGLHNIKSDNNSKFGLSIYGYNNFDAYGYMAGTSLTETNCEIYQDDRQSIGFSITYPFSYGFQYEIGYSHYNLVVGYQYSPNVSIFDGTPTPDSLLTKNYQHTFFISPSYIAPFNCKLYFFYGPYVGLGYRKYSKTKSDVFENKLYRGLKEGSFIEYYFGGQIGAKLFFTDHLFFGIAFSLNAQTIHRFNDDQIIGVKLGEYLFMSLNYTF